MNDSGRKRGAASRGHHEFVVAHLGAKLSRFHHSFFELREVNMQLWNWRGLDVINAHERNPETYLQGMSLAVEAIVRGQLDPTPLYTHRFQLDQLPQAFEAMRERPGNFLKALVTYD